MIFEMNKCVNCETAFDLAVAGGGWRLKPASAMVYRSMWRAYAARLGERSCSQVTAKEIEDAVLSAYPDNRNTANKLFRVVLKAYEHAGPGFEAAFNEARTIEHRFFEKSLARRDCAPAEVAIHTTAESTDSWKKARNRALNALVLKASPRLNELRTLRVCDLSQAQGGLDVKLGRGSSARCVSLPSGSIECAAMQAYLAVHPCRTTASALLFCSDEEGAALHASTLYRQVRVFTESHGAAPNHHGVGAYRARLAKTMLRAGRPMDEVRRALGHALLSSTEDFVKKLS